MKENRKMTFEMLTRQEMHDMAQERISIISKEFKDAFKFIEQFPRSVTFFGGSRFTEDHPYYKEAVALAGKIARELKYAIITGGGPGIMEAGNRGAFENKGVSAGLTIQLPHEQVTNPYLTHHIDFFYFFSRKVALSFAAEAYVFFPGGYGTLDELFEILNLVQTRKIEPVPVILVGKEYWRDLDAFIRNKLLVEKTIDEADMQLYTITDNLDDIVHIIRKTPIRNGITLNYTKKEKNLKDKHCEPCEGDTEPMTPKESVHMLQHLNQWELIEDHSIEKILEFKDFAEAMKFINSVAQIAEKEGHHPNITLFNYKKVKVELTTHAIDGLSENDFVLASKIDELLRKTGH